MSEQNRRSHRRASVRLPLSSIGNQQWQLSGAEVWTSNISAGGMYFSVPTDERITPETELSFELKVPPGSGYSLSGGSIKGSGQVIRTESIDDDAVGVAVSFSKPLSLAF